jgi:hypothetical protein
MSPDAFTALLGSGRGSSRPGVRLIAVPTRAQPFTFEDGELAVLRVKALRDVTDPREMHGQTFVWAKRVHERVARGEHVTVGVTSEQDLALLVKAGWTAIAL